MRGAKVPDPISILKTAKTVAVIGASTRAHRPSRHAVEMLVSDGYTVIPVNPRYTEVLGLRCLPDFSLIPAATRVDVINVFRRPEAVPEFLDEVAGWMSKTDQSPVVWTQLGVSSPAARERAAVLDIPYIEERCIMVELERLAGAYRSNT